MWHRPVLTAIRPRPAGTPAGRARRPTVAPRLRVEALEDRSVPSTFTVTNLLDGGPGSLRAAVAAANASPGADAIDFGVTGSIGLTSGQLDITDSLTINGPGAGALTVSGERVSRVFGIVGDPTVEIADLTVANGWTVGSPGGGISMTGGTLTLEHVTVSGNYAVGVDGTAFDGALEGGEGAGGGIYVGGGTLTLGHVTVSGNYAVGGTGYGGYAEPYGYAGGRANGGGLYIAGGVAYLNQSTVSVNYAVGGSGGDSDSQYWAGWLDTYGGNGGNAVGGGIFVGGRLEVRQSTVSLNSANGGLGGAGGYFGQPGVGVGGGIYTPADPPVTHLDTFTVANTVDNFADIDPDISGPYSLLDGLTISDVSMLEGNTGTAAFIFTVSLGAASTQTVTVGFATADGTAAAGSDYEATSGTLTFAPGETSKTVAVPVNGDRLGEPNEAFFVTLSGATNAAIGDGQGVGTILDDEPRISINDVSRSEGNSGQTAFVFTLTLSAASDAPVTVDWATADGSAKAGSDYLAAGGTLTFAPGETTQAVSVAVLGDAVFEPSETFSVHLGNASGALITRATGWGTIANDDSNLPGIRISDVSRTEGRNGNTLFTFTVTLSVPSTGTVTVRYATADGTARAGEDYEAVAGTLTFAPGETTKTVTIKVKGDQKKEADETFALNLSGAVGASLLDGQGLGTIVNDD